MRRAPVYAGNGVVATSQPLAAQTGLAVLREGGNAVDAAIATAITLTVVQPGSNDIGGDMFALVWDGLQLHGLNASGRSPAALTRDLMAQHAEAPSLALGGAQAAPKQAPPSRGWLPVTVPGAPAGWRDLHQRYGRLPFERLFSDAIHYAEQGWPVSPAVAAGWARAVTAYQELDLAECSGWGWVYAPTGRAPGPGEWFSNPAAARTLRLIAASHGDDFYHGEIATALASFAAETGGLLDLADLASHTSTWVDPIAADYRGHTVYELPPNGQGVAALQALALLDGLAEHTLHEQIEAMKLGFADAHAYVADPATGAIPDLLDPAYLARRRALIGAQAGDPPPGDPMRGGTVYLCAADPDGVMVSLIQSNYQGFGSFVVLEEYGFGLQNRGAGFSLDPSHPNVAAGGKRPFHTIIPGFLSRGRLDDGGVPIGPFGVMGGHMQPQGHLQLVLATVDEGLDPQQALTRPRWYWHSGRQVMVEPDLPQPRVAQLRQHGHDVTVAEQRSGFGMGQAIWRLPGGGYIAGSEPRADGQAAGW